MLDDIKFLTPNAVPSTLTLNDISKATAQDESLCALKNALSRRGNWNEPKQKLFKQIKNEITIDHDHQVSLRDHNTHVSTKTSC